MKRAVRVEDGRELGVYVVEPAGAPRGAVIVLQEIFGVNAHIRDVTERFAREGYLAVAPDLFHRSGAWWEGSYHPVAAKQACALATAFLASHIG